MSRWRQDPNGAAAELVRRSLASLDLAGRCLIANAGGLVADALRATGLDVTAWSRRASDGGDAKPWPDDDSGLYDCVLLRLAKSKDEQEMTLAACLGVLREGGSLVLFGGNDEGIRSAITALEDVCGPAETVSTKGHGRMVRVTRPAGTIAGAALADWRRTVPFEVGGARREWITYPGLFAADRLDEGTSLMLSVLPNLRAVARVLDYGCGSGVIAGTMQARLPGAQIDLVDADSVALLAASENVKGATAILGTSLKATGTTRYDAILSNPPLHAGVAEDHSALERLMAQAPKHLRPGGILQMVVQRRLPLGQSLEPLFSEHSIVA